MASGKVPPLTLEDDHANVVVLLRTLDVLHQAIEHLVGQSVAFLVAAESDVRPTITGFVAHPVTKVFLLCFHD
ncbi:hypothetical protein D3C76_1539460 [compost metagenome]